MRICPPFTLVGLDEVVAAYLYDTTARCLVRSFKYRNNRSLLSWATTTLAVGASALRGPAGPVRVSGASLAVAAVAGRAAAVDVAGTDGALHDRALHDRAIDDGAIDVVTWVPASVAGRRRRGYDQARLLAEGVARRLELPAVELLRRGSKQPQTGASRGQRLQGPRFHPVPQPGAWSLVPRWPVHPLNVLIVDDVITTGASMRTAAAALRGIGTGRVYGCALARADRLLSAGQSSSEIGSV